MTDPNRRRDRRGQTEITDPTAEWEGGVVELRGDGGGGGGGRG